MGRREQIAGLRDREDEVSKRLLEVRERLGHIRVDPAERGPYRSQNVEGDRGEQRALLREEADLMRERERIRRALAEIGIHHGLPLLAQVTIASPCPASWEDMLGSGNVRFCEQCSKHVYDLSTLTQAEAEELVVRHEGKLCAQVYLRNDGTILTADCWVGKRRTLVVALCAAGSAAVIAAGALAYDSMPIGATLGAAPPCDLERNGANTGVMIPITGRAPVNGATCQPAPPERTQTGRTYVTRGMVVPRYERDRY